MRLVETKSVKAGTRLAKAIYNEHDEILVREGVELTDRTILRLQELGVSYIYIQDDVTANLVIHESISEETRRKAVTAIRSEFSKIANETTLKKIFNEDIIAKGFTSIIGMILEDITNNEDALTLLTETIIYDSYIFSHSLNVTVYTLGLANYLNYSKKQLFEIGLGAMLHDVGKMVIPLHILNKPGRLTSEEFSLIKSHTTVGYEIIKKIPNLALVSAHCALQHHERMDGSGYPMGRKGDDIHPYAKIIAVCDVFDAITSNRSYRKGLLPHEGLELLFAGHALYDKEIVEALRNVCAIYPKGLSVQLSDGRKGIVVKQNKEVLSRPVVRIYADGERKVAPYNLDMLLQVNVTIVKCEKAFNDERILVANS
ncbi:HD-GYP domain-containing protein [Alkalihalobacillus sp. LMS39]|uniref:HD-GYP domain-containing protein n=1 Tax=Alkalihalobacillus sp. LMS39 TaxID=2924032 RepID=UPI001FB29205|nr:HD-GYP domain-containing protein [Alkalihalobacillus sp. LMS39]UOE93673.1 HD-GYP domain-containing protein [Alkalihalobacillus sp. LMS39]